MHDVPICSISNWKFLEFHFLSSSSSILHIDKNRVHHCTSIVNLILEKFHRKCETEYDQKQNEKKNETNRKMILVIIVKSLHTCTGMVAMTRATTRQMHSRLCVFSLLTGRDRYQRNQIKQTAWKHTHTHTNTLPMNSTRPTKKQKKNNKFKWNASHNCTSTTTLDSVLGLFYSFQVPFTAYHSLIELFYIF